MAALAPVFLISFQYFYSPYLIYFFHLCYLYFNLHTLVERV
jgi:hypothetical protein